MTAASTSSFVVPVKSGKRRTNPSRTASLPALPFPVAYFARWVGAITTTWSSAYKLARV